MVYINIEQDNFITLHCHKNNPNGEYFKLVLDPHTKELVERPNIPDIDASCAYSRIFGILMRGEPIPDKTVAEWGQQPWIIMKEVLYGYSDGEKNISLSNERITYVSENSQEGNKEFKRNLGDLPPLPSKPKHKNDYER